MINGTETVHRHRENTIAVGLKCIAESGTIVFVEGTKEQYSTPHFHHHLRHVVIVMRSSLAVILVPKDIHHWLIETHSSAGNYSSA